MKDAGSRVLLFGVALFLSAFLVFCVQPMIAKIVLPLLGGSPAVWSTCMVFFQAALLAGYAYAHATTKLFAWRVGIILHAGLIFLPLVVLPLRVSAGASETLFTAGDPSGWLLLLLLGVVGLPFFVLSTSAPLLQRWFSQSGHSAGSDPYFLYAASNLGSMVGLLGYPFLIEPNLGLSAQSAAWTAGYGLFVALTLGCAVAVWRARFDTDSLPDRSADPSPSRVRAKEYLRWMVLAFVPSSYMLGVTTYMTTDLAAMPLLWVIPLALYLLTFILTFARRPPLAHRWMIMAFPMAAVMQALVMNISSATQPFFIPVHLLSFFLAAMVCHGELARTRPTREHLTAFYLTMASGGVLGGLFNAIFAPIAFDRVAEYPMALIVACLVLPPAASQSAAARSLQPAQPLSSVLRPSSLMFRNLALPALVGTVLWGLLAFLQRRPDSEQANRIATCAFGLAALACYAFKERPMRFALAIGAVLLAGGTYTAEFGRVLFQHRNYFGVLRVTFVPEGNLHRLIHGQTMHGQQSLDPARQREPLTYYHRTGPIGQVFSEMGPCIAGSDIAIVGLGAGTLACYAQPGQRWTFYEIDPAVAKIARDSRYFTYLRDSQAASTEIILGDARLRLRDAQAHGYALIVLDAFSSDAIPTHLLTREALALYVDKLSDGGVIAFHISNKYIDLAPVLAALAADSRMTCLVRRDTEISPEDSRLGKSTSMWAVVATRAKDLAELANDSRWESPKARSSDAVWTDDFSSIAAHLILLPH
jgi:hypothetical protein